LAASDAAALRAGRSPAAVIGALSERLPLFCFLVALAPALTLALAQPVWSRIDEPQHFDLIDQYAHGVNPVEAVTTIRPETLALMEATGVYSGDLPGVWPSPYVDPAGFSPPPPGLEGYPRLLWMARHRWQFSYETQQAPLFYIAAVPVFLAADAAGGPLAAVFALRILEALMAAAVAPLAFLIALEVTPSRRVAMAAGLTAGLVPGFVLNGTQVTNDTPAIALSAVALLLALRWGRRGARPHQVLLLGLLLGAALLTKLSALAIAPAVAAALILPAWRSRELVRRIVAAAAVGAISIGCLTPWFAVNYRIYGALTAAAPASGLGAVPHVPATGAYLGQSAVHAFITYWSGEPLLTLAGWAPYCLLALVASAFAAVGLVRVVREEEADRASLLVLVVAVAAGCVFTIALPAVANDPYLAPGRYAYAALPAVAVLLALGLGVELRGKLFAAVTAVLYGASVLLLGAFVAGLPPAEQPGPRHPDAATVVGSDLSGSFGSVAVNIDQLGIDRRGGALWLHVQVSDRGSKAAEWTPVPVASRDGNVVGMADYLQSTALPQHLEPGATNSGWIKVPLPASALDDRRPLNVTFLDVAVDDYARVGAIKFDVSY
jgi:hypothetical protein